MLPNLTYRCALCALLLIIPYFCHSQCWPRSQKLVPTKSYSTTENLGESIDHQGNIAVVGAPNSDTLRSSSGVVYVFELTNNTWRKIASLTASDHREYKNFGLEVIIHGDYIFVADPGRANDSENSGAVYVYKRPPDGWHDMVETTILTPTHPTPYHFASSMTTYENQLLVGAPYTQNEADVSAGAAFLFELKDDSWTQVATFKSAHPRQSTFGSNVALGKNTVVIAASEETALTSTTRGAVYVFEKDDIDNWTDAYPTARLTESSGDESIAYLGTGLQIDESRNTIFVTEFSWGGASPYGKAIKVYKKGGTKWSDMTETYSYLGGFDSKVWYQKLSYQEPYLYSAGSRYVSIFKPDENNDWTLSSPVATLSISDFNLQKQFGEDISVDGGRVLVSAPSRVTLDRDTLIAPATPAIYEFKIPEEGWPEGFSLEDRSFTYMPRTAADYFYGFDVDMEGDIAIVGSPRDNTRLNSSGAVYVYKLENYTWNKIATLTPSDGEPYDNFGQTVSISKDHIAVGVSEKHFRDESGRIVDHNLGAVYIFKKPVAGWSDMHESYKIIRNEGFLDGENDREDDRLGITVDMDYPYLVASRFDEGSRPNNGSILVFNLTDDDPVLEAVLNPSFRDAVNDFGRGLCIRDSIIAVGCGTTRFWMGETNTVFVYQKQGDRWKDATESAMLMPSDNGTTGYLPGISFGHSIDMTEDGSAMIVGAPAWFDGVIFQTTEYFKGAAYIFERPDSGWKGLIREKARLTVPDQPAYGCMGLSVHIEDRYAVVGSPQNYYYTYGAQQEGPGRVYFYQKPDDGWKYKLPDKVIVGDEAGSPLSDYFGADVDGVFGFLMVGAFADDNQNDLDAGSVYVYTEYPFINPTPSPICENANPVQLTAVPAGGKWQGNGLTNADDGIFYPTVAGMGQHKIRYSADGCDAANTLLINIIEIPRPALANNVDSLFFCGQTSLTLGSPRPRSFSYSWSYSTDGKSYSPTANQSPIMQATREGYYKLLMSNKCATTPDSVWVGDLRPKGGLDFNICNTSETLQLYGNYSNGAWVGPGVSPQGAFDPRASGPGLHKLFYFVSPVAGCIYKDTVQAKVSSFPPLAIQSDGAQSICYRGATTLSVPAVPNGVYTWYTTSSTGERITFGANATSNEVSQFGSYAVEVSDGTCVEDVSMDLIKPEFQPQVSPIFDSLAFCSNSPITVKAEAIAGANYAWLEDVNGVDQIIKETTGAFTEIINVSGKFKLRIISHGCEFETVEMVTHIIDTDSVFVPNVITPNGDPLNEALEVYVEGAEDYSLNVFNRHGQHIWSTQNINHSWDAADVSSGTYFWLLSYKSKCATAKVLKGWVQVLKE